MKSLRGSLAWMEAAPAQAMLLSTRGGQRHWAAAALSQPNEAKTPVAVCLVLAPSRKPNIFKCPLFLKASVCGDYGAR
jgi:hypothetical protein